MIPTVFTEKQFNDYLSSINEKAQKEGDIVKYYSDFALHFEHNIVDNLYVLRDFKNLEEMSVFLLTYPIPIEIKKEALLNYTQNGIVPVFSGEKSFYSLFSENTLNSARGKGEIGTSSEEMINIGKYNSCDLYIDLKDNKLKCAAGKEGALNLIETDFEVIGISKTEDSISIRYGINKDKNGIYESFLSLTLNKISYRAENLSEKEFQRIVDDIYVKFTDVHDTHWQLKDSDDESKRIKTTDIHILFEGMELTETQKATIIAALYEKKDIFRKVKIGGSVGQGNKNPQYKEEYSYSYYILKKNADFSKAQSVLSEYKKEIVRTKKYPFYNISNSSYHLKDEWRNFKDKETARSEWISEIESEILKSDSELKTKNPTQFAQQVDVKFEKRYAEYLVLNTLFVAECEKFNFGKYAEIKFIQDFNLEHLYRIKNSTYSVIIADDSFNLKTVSFSIPKKEWDSAADFSAKNLNNEKIIYSYEKEISEDGGSKAQTEKIRVSNDEFLYGGENNWSYGIWKGSLSEIAFSKKKLREFEKSKESIKSEQDFESKANLDSTKIDANQKANQPKDIIHFYLPGKQSENDISKDIADFKNAAISYDVDLSKSLLGTISMNSEVRKTREGRQNVTEYYMPFIFGDIIHTDRAGGISYYKIEGITDKPESPVEQLPGTSLLPMPAIRKSYTEATDETPIMKIAIGPIGMDFSKTTKSDVAQESYNASISIFGKGGSVGENNSTSTSKQVVQDVNADGIPDIVQIDNGVLRVTAGTKVNEKGEICFNNLNTLTGISYLSKNETSTKVYGASVSAQGSVRQVPKMTPSGNIKYVVVEPQASPNASADITYSKGSSIQTHGIGDINGDGLPDYYNGNCYALSNGSNFSPEYTKFTAQELSKNETQAIGMNFSAGVGTGGFVDLSSANSLKSYFGGSVGITYDSTSSNTEKMMLDINGDGLQDILEMESGSSAIEVRYNTGNGFIKGQQIKLPGWRNYVSANYEKFLNQADSDGFDLGLIEGIPVIGVAIKDKLTKVSINPFGLGAKKLSNSLDWNTSVTLGMCGTIGANIDIAFDIWATLVYCGTISVVVSGGAGANATTSINGACVKLMDLDGDGLADHVLRIPGFGMYWKRNISGRYGLLNTINLPQGGKVEIDYAEKYGTEDNPNFKYVMSKLTMNDGTDGSGLLPKVEQGVHSVTVQYEYEGGYYDRQKKDFYGFRTVKTTNADGSYRIDEYNVREYYAKGSLERSCLYAKDKTLLSKSETELRESPFSQPKKEKTWLYEKSSGEENCIRTSTEYEYDGYGNCKTIRQEFGNGKKLSGEIVYDNSDTTNYIIGLPVDIRVYGTDGEPLRHRAGRYDRLGQLIELRQYYDDYNYSENTLTYDEYGNITSVSDSGGAKLTYTYDKDVNIFVVKVAQSGNGTDTYISELEYNPATQTKSFEKDSNGNTLKYSYDNWQRIEKILTSYDTDENPAVSYKYYTAQEFIKDENTQRLKEKTHELWYAVTSNKVTFDSADKSAIQTVIQVDGLGRAVRSAKTGSVNGVDGWNASGAVEYDTKGRTVKEGMTEFIAGDLHALLASVPKMTEFYTSYEYDEKDRRVQTTLPDGEAQYAEFEIRDGKTVAYSIDPLENVSVQETDSQGNIVRTAKKDKSGKQLTEVGYNYNELEEMLSAFDAKGHPIKAEYDLLGRRTALESLDSGRQEFFYDESSNLVRETNSVLRERNKQIIYEYDGLNRLIKIDYPDTEDTVYTYGSANDTKGAAGKILKVEDASGTLEYEYGKLGEIIKERRLLKTHLNAKRDKEMSEMEYRSDYLGRMQSIVYPDGEKVVYGYDRGGQVVSVTGEHYGTVFKYVTNILYDQYGQRTRIDYGNGTFTEYNYDPARRWLDSIKTENKWGQNFQNISYRFDTVGNVLGYENDCLDSVSGNYKTKQTYSYDSLYQLIKVSGETVYNPYRSSVPEFMSNYSQMFEFDSDGLGNMTSKVSTETVKPQKAIGDNLNYRFDYEYDGNFAHRLKRAGERYYKYDANGNVICEQDGSFDGEEDVSYRKIKQERDDVYSTGYGWGLFKEDSASGGSSVQAYRRTYAWNERNQLVSSVDASYSTAYIYGQDGQRSNKYTQTSETLYFNKMWTLHTDRGNNVYGGQTAKNIYLGETRIVTKLNSGENPTYQEEYYKQYYYHSDHLGSASLISDYKGDEYQRIEYAPYGETWVEKTNNTGSEYLPYKFTGKEQDEETGLYYYGARYLDPKYSRWISTDPALGEYIPQAPISDEARKHNQNLPGMGGIYNTINSNLYHYAGNNPIRYIDPDGKAHFGKRPMKTFHDYWGIAASNPIDNLTNTELSHEQLFFDDDKGGNLGFSWDGLFEESKKSYDKYHMDKKQYDDLMRKAVNNVEAGEYSVVGSKIGKLIQNVAKLFGKKVDDKIVGNGKKNNCQDWASRVRKEYTRLFKELPKEEQKRIKAECKEREKEYKNEK